MKNITLLFLIIISIIKLHAQSDFRKGIIVTADEKQLEVEIAFKNDWELRHSVQYKNPDGKVIVSSASDIKSFQYDGGKFYVSKATDSTNVFLEVIVKGKLNVYYAYDQNNEYFFIEKTDQPLVLLPMEVKEIKHDDNSLYGPKNFQGNSTKHMGILIIYTIDMPSLQPDIKAMEYLNKKQLINIAKRYHFNSESAETFKNYEKSSSGKNRTNFISAGTGVGKLGNYSSLENGFYQPRFIGAFNLNTPRLGKYMYLQLGMKVSYYKKVEENFSRQFNKLDIQVLYLNIVKNKLRPTFSFSLLSPEYMVGLNYNFQNNLILGTRVNFDFERDINPWIPIASKGYNLSGLIHLYYQVGKKD